MANPYSLQFPKGFCALKKEHQNEFMRLSESARCWLPKDTTSIVRGRVQAVMLRLGGTELSAGSQVLKLNVLQHAYVQGAIQELEEAKNSLEKADMNWDEATPQPIALYQQHVNSALSRLIFQVGRVTHLFILLMASQNLLRYRSCG